jgi:hypothetical protein
LIVWDTIAPTESLLSGINWVPRLSGDSIATSVWSASTPAGLTIVPNIPGFVANTTLVTISGAVLNVTYFITNSIVTASGQDMVETVQVTCAPK